MGESVDAVDALLKKHSDFEKTLIAQSEKIDSLKKDADELAKKDADYRADIENRFVLVPFFQLWNIVVGFKFQLYVLFFLCLLFSFFS